MQGYTRFWTIAVVNHGDAFETGIWRDYLGQAVAAVRAMYPNAETISVVHR